MNTNKQKPSDKVIDALIAASLLSNQHFSKAKSAAKGGLPKGRNPTLRKQIRLWAEANEPTRAVECAVKLWNFIQPLRDSQRALWMDQGFSAIWERIKENEQNK